MRIAMVVLVMIVAMADWRFAMAAGDKREDRSAPTESMSELASIDGYRSAKFGMVEKDVRGAIKKDFGIDAPRLEANEIQKTQALVTTVKDLLPGAPPALVSYIFGMSSGKLIQVNLVWGGEPGGVDLRNLLPAANALRDYFLQRTYDTQSLAINQQLSNGVVLFFRGADARGREIRLELLPLARKGDSKEAAAFGALKLSYAENPKNPDIYKIKEGAF
ncbi:MAG: hypothetical protein ACM3W7_13240 [Acidobacteriota bacterium]